VRIGVDIDGVLADFTGAFSALIEQEFGIKLPQPWQTWNWHKDHGVTPEQNNYLWELIKAGPFHGTLMPMPGALDAIERLNRLSVKANDIYFITSRKGELAKFWAEMWLKFHGMDLPTVLLAEDKGALAKGLNLSVFVDDYWENTQAVIVASPATRTYLVDAPYNRHASPDWSGIRVKDLNEVLDREFPSKARAA
jgi:uncharacterized HAD superfamily protein